MSASAGSLCCPGNNWHPVSLLSLAIAMVVDYQGDEINLDCGNGEVARRVGSDCLNKKNEKSIKKNE